MVRFLIFVLLVALVMFWWGVGARSLHYLGGLALCAYLANTVVGWIESGRR